MGVTVKFACGHQQTTGGTQRPVCRVCGERRIANVISRTPTVTAKPAAGD